MTIEFSVTLSGLRKAGACVNGYNKLVRAIQGMEFSHDDMLRDSYIRFAHKTPVPLLLIVESNGIEDALWTLRCVPGVDRDARLFAVWCARQVQHLMTDPRSINALDVAERFANGMATGIEMSAARAAAGAATWDAAGDAARAAARAAAGAATWAAAEDAAWAAARVAAGVAAWDAAWDAVWAAARDAQKAMFVCMCKGDAPWQK